MCLVFATMTSRAIATDDAGASWKVKLISVYKSLINYQVYVRNYLRHPYLAIIEQQPNCVIIDDDYGGLV